MASGGLFDSRLVLCAPSRMRKLCIREWLCNKRIIDIPGEQLRSWTMSTLGVGPVVASEPEQRVRARI